MWHYDVTATFVAIYFNSQSRFNILHTHNIEEETVQFCRNKNLGNKQKCLFYKLVINIDQSMILL